MRLWHTKFINVLPREQLVATWRELSAIAGAIQKNGTPNHVLVNFVTDYDYDHFISYVDKMLTKIDYFTCVLPYTLSLHHGLLSQKRVDAMMEDENLSEVDFKMEFEVTTYFLYS